jgi:hypothetical protein
MHSRSSQEGERGVDSFAADAPKGQRGFGFPIAGGCSLPFVSDPNDRGLATRDGSFTKRAIAKGPTRVLG